MNHNRILVVDDNRAIHDDIRKILSPAKPRDKVIDDLERALFDDEHDVPPPAEPLDLSYEIDSAYQGKEALEMVRTADAEGRPYALLFMDVRMPPGWNGVETILHVWRAFPHTEVILCTAYSDYTWENIISTIGLSDRLLILKKPFDPMVVKQMCLMLTQKWRHAHFSRESLALVDALEQETKKRTRRLRTLLRG